MSKIKSKRRAQVSRRLPLGREFQKLVEAVRQSLFSPSIRIYVPPGGNLPVRKTEGAIGYDAHARAIVHPKNKDGSNPNLREALFDFLELPRVGEIRSHVERMPKSNGDGTELTYRLDPNESVLVSIGFVTDMPLPMFYWVAPRSGLAMDGIQVTNAPGTVDPDYRGEAGVLVWNRTKEPFWLRHNMRICQIIFCWALIPQITEVEDYDLLDQTKRGVEGFGSTGY